MCDCNTDCNCPSTELPSGSDGSNGLYGGFSSNWRFDTATAANPSSTYLRFNSTTYSSVTTIYVNDTNGDSANLDLFLDSLDNSGVFGRIRIFKEYDSNTFWEGDVTAVVDSGTYHTLTVTYILSNGSFTANDDIVLSFAPRGATGATGSSGPALPLTTGFVTASSLNQNIGAVTGSDVIISGLTFSISTAGTYRFWYEGTVYNDTATHSGYYGIYVNTVQSSGTQRTYGTATASLSGVWYKTGCNQDIVISGASTVDVRFRAQVAANTLHTAGTFCYIRIA